MNVFIESLTTEFTVFDGELPLSERQLEQVVSHGVAALGRLEGQRRDQHRVSTLDAGFEEAFHREERRP